MRIKQFRNISSITISLSSRLGCSIERGDNANFTGICPHTFKFTGTITTRDQLQEGICAQNT